MIIGKVVGTVVTTISHRDYKIGDTVLVNREGNGARQALKNPEACVISVIVGIIDSVHLDF